MQTKNRNLSNVRLETLVSSRTMRIVRNVRPETHVSSRTFDDFVECVPEGPALDDDACGWCEPLLTNTGVLAAAPRFAIVPTVAG